MPCSDSTTRRSASQSSISTNNMELNIGPDTKGSDVIKAFPDKVEKKTCKHIPSPKNPLQEGKDPS